MIFQLQCPNCGAQLEVRAELETFACQFCGTSVALRREGGTVALERMEASLRRVEVNTDRTAAELALARYEQELAQLEAEFAGRDSANSMRVGCGALIGCICFVAAAGFWLAGNGAFAVSVVVAGLAAFWYSRLALKDSPAGAMRMRRAALRQRIAETRRFLDGALTSN